MITGRRIGILVAVFVALTLILGQTSLSGDPDSASRDDPGYSVGYEWGLPVLFALVLTLMVALAWYLLASRRRRR